MTDQLDSIDDPRDGVHPDADPRGGVSTGDGVANDGSVIDADVEHASTGVDADVGPGIDVDTGIDVSAGPDGVDTTTAEPRADIDDGVDGAPVSWPQRIGQRIVRRPVAWWNREWTRDRTIRVIVTTLSLTITTVVMMRIVHFNPLSPGGSLLLDDTTPTGGDMGAHVWAPAFLRDHFLPNLRWSGWSMDWYGGLPLYRFYMVVPAFAIVALDVILPYGIAFKIVAAVGLLTLPAACWAFGRLAAFRFPIPELFAFGGLCFLLDESFEIYGGNVKSTMAGEYSFSIALTLAVLGLGLLANGLRTGRFRVWTPVVLALACLSHGIVLIFVAVAATIISLAWIDSTRRLLYAVLAGVTTVLLSAWWVGPFLFGHEHMTDMKYGFRPQGANDSFWDMYFPLTPALDILVTALAVVGVVALAARRHRTGTALGVIALLFGFFVWHARESLPIIGLLWNPRLLPFLYLVRYLLMMVGAFELVSLGINALRRQVAGTDPGVLASAIGAAAIGVTTLGVFGWMYESLPGGGRVTVGDQSVYAWGPLRKPLPSGDDYRSRAVADGWTRYNWQGYEGRSQYPQYYDVVSTMDRIGDERGCGRAVWENNSANSEYGTTMALMLLPHWTDSCIASMEGLFFEASGTTPYHFLTTSALSEAASDPVRQLRYVKNDAEVGVQHMRDLGVRYLMARTDAAKAEARQQPELELIATSGVWEIYELADARIVEALTVQPVVVEHEDGDGAVVRDRPGDERERNLEIGTSWFQRRDTWPALPAADGPEQWQRVRAEIDLGARSGEPGARFRSVDYVVPVEPIDEIPLPEVAVTDVVVDDEAVSFQVDQVGVPVLVRVSYFPNWEVSGAEGPYRVAPNHMVVIPTDTQVRLGFATSSLDWFFYLLTVLGIGLCVLWRRNGDMKLPPVDEPAYRPADPSTDTGVDRIGVASGVDRVGVASGVDEVGLASGLDPDQIATQVDPVGIPTPDGEFTSIPPAGDAPER